MKQFAKKLQYKIRCRLSDEKGAKRVYKNITVQFNNELLILIQ